MKKLTLALLCVVSVLLIASCSKKEEEKPILPTVEFVNAGEGYVYQNTEVQPGQMVGFQVRAIANDPKDLLTSLEVKKTIAFFGHDSTFFDTIIAIDKQTTYPFTVNKPKPDMMVGGATLTVEAIAKTQKGQQNTAKVVVTVVDPALEVHDLTWQRVGGAAATGLEQFGLEWTSNAKEVKAKIVPKEGYILFDIKELNFNDITTEMQKTIAFSTDYATQIEKFHEISCEANKDYDYLLGTVNIATSEMYLIHITKGTVETAAAGTTVTIKGQWK